MKLYISPENLGQELNAIRDKKLCILGASGQVGRRILSILSEHNFPAQNLTLVAREPKDISYGIQTVKVHPIDKTDLDDFDIAISCLPSKVVKENIGAIWNERCVIVDKSSAFRDDPEVPLVIPEVNGECAQGARLIASPNCVAIPLTMVLDAILPKLTDVTQIAASTYQSVSGAGDHAMRALIDETHETFMYNPKVMPQFFKKQIAFNVIPQIGDLNNDYESEEENKIARETKRILQKDLPLSVMAVRVPVMIGHCIALHIACKFKSLLDIEAALESYGGIKYLGPERAACPIEFANENYVFVCRLRRTDSGLCMWVLTDNLQKGAALNALQIALLAIKNTAEFTGNNNIYNNNNNN